MPRSSGSTFVALHVDTPPTPPYAAAAIYMPCGCSHIVPAKGPSLCVSGYESRQHAAIITSRGRTWFPAGVLNPAPPSVPRPQDKRHASFDYTWHKWTGNGRGFAHSTWKSNCSFCFIFLFLDYRLINCGVHFCAR